MTKNESKRGPKPLYGAKMRSHITVWLPFLLNKQLTQAARKLNRKRADLVRTAIEDFLSFLDRN